MNAPISQALMRVASATREHGSLSVAECMKLLRHESILLAVFFFALLNVLPFAGIPGFSTLTGLPILFLGVQLMLASDTVWLPARVRDHCLRPGKLMNRLEQSLVYLERLERLLKPRWMRLSGEPARRAIGGIIAVVAGLLALPVPLANFPCGLAIAVLALGLMVRDGLVILIGLVCTVLACAVVFAMGNVLGAGWDMLFDGWR